MFKWTMKVDRIGFGNSKGIKMADLSLFGGYALVGIGIILKSLNTCWFSHTELEEEIERQKQETEDFSDEIEQA